MSKGSRFLVLLVAFLVPAAKAALVDHSPTHLGFSTSDTEFLVDGTPSFQTSADDFRINTASSVQQIVWWGGYTGTTPSAGEPFRVRLYGDNATNSVPGDLRYEVTVNPLRASTGLEVRGEGISIPEYIFQANLGSPMLLSADTPYWLEIAQFGDPNSRFVWDFSATEQNGYAFMSSSDAPWQKVSGSDLAFQLSITPEPSAVYLLLAGAFLWLGSLRRGV